MVNILGAWRTTKINWHSDYITVYTFADRWRQYTFTWWATLCSSKTSLRNVEI
jgi:hypothetical protein